MGSTKDNVSEGKKRKRSDDSESASDVENNVTTKNKNKKFKVDTERAIQLKQALQDHELSVTSAQIKNKKNHIPGKIRANRLPHRMDKSIKDKSWPKIDGYKVRNYL